ncbi:hypothetical protein ODZ84_02855 [Chryseobacterium fluminis]|uniref:hypothetical protein n=2 Tax=Chryseobacterium fluminis TaxID=2983606 RepID=UPI0022583E8D|nr:hypothetical protein [Chryseobacterium sp. MMS21-Ot14]UZT98526.1 hypothetical protein ODZ84_02855 [Chryseobacterium sp. MMS21-Ot14]
MTHVKIKNSVIVLAILLFNGCKKQNEYSIQKQEVKKPLVFNVQFQKFENMQLAYNEKKILVDSAIWKDHLQDNIVYFKINFENLKKEAVILKTTLAASKIPIFLKYRKGAEDKVILEIVQQANTVYSDSIILKNDKTIDFPIVENAYRIGYQHTGIDEICQLKVNQHHDTIDISSQKMENCIEKKRK